MRDVRRPGARLRAPLAGAVLLSLVLAGCSGSDDEADPDSDGGQVKPARPVPVALQAAGLPEGPTKIGVVVSLTSAAGEGSQWRQAAEGAQVAAYRFGLGDADVEVVPANDGGTDQGADAAVRDLAEQGVAGIVLATSGTHVEGALEAAADVGVPVLLPYETPPAVDGADAWATGPDGSMVVSGLARALDVSGRQDPVLVDAGGGDIGEISAVARIPLRAGDRARNVASRIAGLIASGEADSVVVAGPASQQATMVRALQGFAVNVPVLLTPDALSPVFAVDLADAGGSLAADVVTVGEAASDVAALRPSTEGRAVAAYFSGLRAAANDPDLQDFFDGRRFETVSDTADVRSHDAVVALVRAVEAAGSTDPGEVAATLGGLTLDGADGLGGPGLDFAGPTAISRRDVVPLQATTQDPGLRPKSGGTGPRLFWFALPEQ